MSATIIHHGHVRLLEKASRLGHVTVALCSDREIMKYKGYRPELTFDQRKEILSAIKFVDSVLESPWIIDDAFMIENKMDLLVHGDDNSNLVAKERLVILPRTVAVSSSEIRELAAEALLQRKKFLGGAEDES
jgi:cytidyltransferase-like protein